MVLLTCLQYISLWWMQNCNILEWYLFHGEQRGLFSNRPSDFYIPKIVLVLFLFQGKERLVKAPSGVHAFAYENQIHLSPKGILPSPVPTAFVLACIEEWQFQVILEIVVKIVMWSEQEYQPSIYQPLSSFCTILLCSFQWGLNGIFRKTCHFFRDRNPL